MPRQARTISPTSIYHAILRGVNKQQVFEDEEDYIHFLNILRRQTQPDVDAQGQTFQPRCHVYAYCLMGNHVHLLLKEGSETIGDIMKRIASSYLSALCGASNATQFQALPRPQQKLHLFAAHEEGIGPRTLSRLTGVPYSIVQRATSDTIRYGSMVCESLPCDEDYQTYIDDSEYEKYPEY